MLATPGKTALAWGGQRRHRRDPARLRRLPFRCSASPPLPPLFFAFLVVTVVTYLGLVEVVKRWFYRSYAM